MRTLLTGLLLLTVAADDDVVARTADAAITRAEFGDWLVDRHGYEHLRIYVIERVVLAEAERRGLLPTDDEIAAAYEAEVDEIVNSMHKGDRERWVEGLQRKGRSEKDFAAWRKQQLRFDLSQRALATVDRVVTDEDVQQRFSEIYGTPPERTQLEVLFYDQYAGDGREQAEARAQRARAGLLDGRPLSDLHPDSDPFPSEFVVDGFVELYRKNLLGPEVDEAVMSLDDPGEVAGPVSVWNGYWVVRLAARDAVTLESEGPALRAAMASAPVTSRELAATQDALWESHGVELAVSARDG